MSGLRGSAHYTLPARFTVRPIVLALAALLVTGIVVVAIALATRGGDAQTGATSERATPSATAVVDSQRTQPPEVNGPGARP